MDEQQEDWEKTKKEKLFVRSSSSYVLSFNVVFNCAGSSIVITREEEIKLFPHSLALIFIDATLYSL